MTDATKATGITVETLHMTDASCELCGNLEAAEAGLNGEKAYLCSECRGYLRVKSFAEITEQDRLAAEYADLGVPNSGYTSCSLPGYIFGSVRPL